MTPQYEPIDLVVPSGHVNCCPCPDHRTNYVGVAYKSYRLRLVDANGLPFRSSGESCTVNLAGVRPSAAAGDATLAFARNGEIHSQYDKTVLGVSIRGGAVDLAACNALNANFGYPMSVRTNLIDSAAPDMKLVTDVKLPGGHVHLELSDATAPFAVWYYDRRNGTFRKLLDTVSTPVKDLSMVYWKTLMKRAVDGNSNEMPIYVTSPAPGRVKLRFRYWNVVGGRFVQDEAVQAVTSVKPPLLVDYNRDGRIDAEDVQLYLAGVRTGRVDQPAAGVRDANAIRQQHAADGVPVRGEKRPAPSQGLLESRRCAAVRLVDQAARRRRFADGRMVEPAECRRRVGRLADAAQHAGLAAGGARAGWKILMPSVSAAADMV